MWAVFVSLIPTFIFGVCGLVLLFLTIKQTCVVRQLNWRTVFLWLALVVAGAGTIAGWWFVYAQVEVDRVVCGTGFSQWAYGIFGIDRHDTNQVWLDACSDAGLRNTVQGFGIVLVSFALWYVVWRIVRRAPKPVMTIVE